MPTENKDDQVNQRPNRIREINDHQQRGVLDSLSMYDCYMSASELADEELKDIIRHQLARYSVQPGINGRLSWGARPMPGGLSRSISGAAQSRGLRGSCLWRTMARASVCVSPETSCGIWAGPSRPPVAYGPSAPWEIRQPELFFSGLTHLTTCQRG